MIVSIRIDDRLIHGQVALVWSKELNTTRIVVANDEAARNDVMKMTLKMATPSGMKLLIKPLQESIDVFNDPRSQDLKLFVLTNCVQDTLEIVKNCLDVELSLIHISTYESVVLSGGLIPTYDVLKYTCKSIACDWIN